MYTLQRDNVVKLTDSKVKRDRYISEGYSLVEQPEAAADTEPESIPETPETEKPAKGKVKPGDKRNT